MDMLLFLLSRYLGIAGLYGHTLRLDPVLFVKEQATGLDKFGCESWVCMSVGKSPPCSLSLWYLTREVGTVPPACLPLTRLPGSCWGEAPRKPGHHVIQLLLLCCYCLQLSHHVLSSHVSESHWLGRDQVLLLFLTKISSGFSALFLLQLFVLLIIEVICLPCRKQ